MKTCISFMKVITSIKELNIALEHVTHGTLLLPQLRPSTVSFLYQGEPPPPISTPWEAYRPQGCL